VEDQRVQRRVVGDGCAGVPVQLHHHAVGAVGEEVREGRRAQRPDLAQAQVFARLRRRCRGVRHVQREVLDVHGRGTFAHPARRRQFSNQSTAALRCWGVTRCFTPPARSGPSACQRRPPCGTPGSPPQWPASPLPAGRWGRARR
jgi:hypothetical protein